MNFRIIIHIMGLLLLCNGGFMFIATLVGFGYGEAAAYGIGKACLVTIGLGILAMVPTRRHRKELKRKEGYLIVTLGWVLLSFSGSLPYVYTGSVDGFTNAFFETISGYTTTGATILKDIEVLPKCVLIWRSLTHWIGGMGIIVLAIAILPLLGIGGMQLFAAEAPGPGGDKLHPRITDTAKRLWLIYFGYTAAETILLNIAGMNVFDAVNHSLSTMSTGGFSTKNASIAYWNDRPIVQYIVMVFMFLAGSNFVLSYFAFTGKVQRVFRDEEFRYYVVLFLLFTLVSGLVIGGLLDWGPSAYHPLRWGSWEGAFRHGAFQVLAVVTTTGFVTADYTAWSTFLTVLFFGLMFLGGSSGSTAGGVKIVRHLLILKNGLLEFKRSLHANAIVPVRYNDRSVSEHIVFNIIGFFVLYMLIFLIGALGLGLSGLDFVTSLGGAASALGNVGPAFGDLYPLANYSELEAPAKWWCGLLMLLGRLELFTVLILFTPYFWRKT